MVAMLYMELLMLAYKSGDISSCPLKNLLQGVALSAIFAVGKKLMTHQGLPITVAIAIAFTPLAINRLTFLAQKQNYLSSDERETIERNFTRCWILFVLFLLLLCLFY